LAVVVPENAHQLKVGKCFGDRWLIPQTRDNPTYKNL